MVGWGADAPAPDALAVPEARTLIVPALLAVVAALAVFSPVLFADAPAANDERYYRAAIAAVRSGQSLSSVTGWFYPDVLAWFWAALAGGIGLRPVFWLLRTLNLAGIALAAAAAARLATPRLAILVAPLLVALYPAFTSCIREGNATGAVIGLIVLTLAARSPGRRALPLAATFLVKPYAVGLAIGLGWLETAVAVVCAALAWTNTSGRDALVYLGGAFNAAPIRALNDLGLRLPWQVWTAAVLLVGLFWARGSWERGLCVSWLSLPLVWTHTGLLLVLPMASAVRRALAHPDPHVGRMRLVVLSGAALVLAQSRYFGIAGASGLASGLLGLFPTAAALAIAALAAPRPYPLDASPRSD